MFLKKVMFCRLIDIKNVSNNFFQGNFKQGKKTICGKDP